MNLEHPTAEEYLIDSGISPNYLTGASSFRLQAALLIVSILCQMDRILPVVLAESLKKELGCNDTQLSLIVGVAFAICHSLMSLPLARAADSGSPKKVLTLCILAWSTLTALGGIASNSLAFAFTRAGVAFGEAGAVPASHSIIGREISPKNRGMAIGIFSMGLPLGAMFGFSMGGWVNDHYGWRTALIGAGVIGWLVALIVSLVIPRIRPLKQTGSESGVGSILQASKELLSYKGFRWMLVSASVVGLASGPFYIFAMPFLLRVHHMSATEAGASFGVLQGLLGILGTIIGGRGFDRVMQWGQGNLLIAPAIVFLLASVTTIFALFAHNNVLTIGLLVPLMFSFTFMLPWAFGAAHYVAGPEKRALASGILQICSNIVGPIIGPLIVGMVSDAVTAANYPHGLRWGLLLVPIASLATGICLLITNNQIRDHYFVKDR